MNATDGESGLTKQDVLAEVREFAPGLPASEEWQHLYAGIHKEQKAVAGMFGG